MENGAEQEIGEWVTKLEAKGHQFPRKLGNIPGFPYSTFDSFSRAVAANDVLLQRFAYLSPLTNGGCVP